MTPAEVRRSFAARVDAAERELREALAEDEKRIERLRIRVLRYRARLSDPEGREEPERPQRYPDTIFFAEEEHAQREKLLRRSLHVAEVEQAGALRALEMLGL